MINRAIGAVAGGGFLLLVAGIGYLMYRREAMGMGDVKLLALIGLFLGWRVLPLILFLSAIQAIAIVALITLAQKFFKLDTGFVRTTEQVDAHFGESELYEHLDEPSRLAIPFGPFLALAAVEGLIIGDAFFWEMIDSLLQVLMSSLLFAW
jgi:leader peptidase (prepilin peptidase)/N-methyltransferase